MIVGLIVLLYVAQRKFQTILKMMIIQIIVAGDFYGLIRYSLLLSYSRIPSSSYHFRVRVNVPSVT